jgi:poly[(R)-3-hydroxyalkanoate] polymerase subunit PhaC
MDTDGNTKNPWLQAQQAYLEESTAFLNRMSRIPGLWSQAQNVQKGVTPSEVVYEKDRMKLLRYMAQGPVKYDTPLLFVFALVNRPYILDIFENKSVVAHFVKAGFDTYLIDWGKPTYADRHLNLDVYINDYLQSVVKFVQQNASSPQVNVLGYCMGGTMSAMYTALHPEFVKNLILLAAGIDFSTRDGLLNLWTDSKYFNVDAFVDAFGNCPAEYLQACFLMLKPVRSFLSKNISLFEKLEDKKHVEEFLTMESWLNDNVPVAGEVFREFVKYLYQQNRLTQNRLTIAGRHVNLKRITCPVLNLMAEHDDLVPPAQSQPFNDLVGSQDREIIKLATGHIGLAMGSAAQRELWPHVVEWLAQRS